MTDDLHLKVGIMATEIKNITKSVDDLSARTQVGFDKLEKLIQDIAETKADKEAVDELKDNQKWLVRLVVGVVVVALLGLVVANVQ